MTDDSKPRGFRSLREFYPFYLSEHQHPWSRVLHFTGTSLILVWLAMAAALRNPWCLMLIPLAGYGFAWVGHFFFERNKPATFRHPLYSLASDFKLWWELLIGKERFRPIRP